MVMAEGKKSLLGVVEVGDSSQEGILQREPCMQEEKTRARRKEYEKPQTEKACGGNAQGNGESREITPPVGCKIAPKNETDIVLHTNNILESLKTMSLPLPLDDYPHQLQQQVYQNVGVDGLKMILENVCKLLREGGHQTSRRLSVYLSILHKSCSTSAAVKRVRSCPGIIPLYKDFIDTYMIGFIGTPFLKAGQLYYLAYSLAIVLRIVGKFMAFSKPSQTDDLFTWWKSIDELYRDRILSAISHLTPQIATQKAINHAFHGLELMSACFMGVSESMERMQTTDPPQPYEILEYFISTRCYVVFCSSLQCPVYAEKDGVLLHCARCKLAAYCSRQCQRQHWKQGHKEKCWEMTWDFNLRLKLGRGVYGEIELVIIDLNDELTGCKIDV